LLTCVDAPLLTAQPFAVEEPCAGEVHNTTATPKPVDRFEVEGFRILPFAQ
jgi:hypothetical protein